MVESSEILVSCCKKREALGTRQPPATPAAFLSRWSHSNACQPVQARMWTHCDVKLKLVRTVNSRPPRPTCSPISSGRCVINNRTRHIYLFARPPTRERTASTHPIGLSALPAVEYLVYHRPPA